MALLPTPPAGVPLLNPITQSVDILWQNYFNALATLGGGFAPLNATYWVSSSSSDLTNETNIGSLTTGYLKIVSAAGTATPSTVTTIPAGDITGAALTSTDDTNVTLVLGGTPATALLRAASLTMGWTGKLGLARGGTNADLSATGGAGQVLQQTSVGGAITVGAITVAASAITGPGALTKTDDTNVTLTLGGSPSVALLAAASLTLGWTGTLSVSRGGTGLGSGTSGGVLAYTASGTLASSAALAANAPMIGGGAGVVPSTITAGTTNQKLIGITAAAPSFRTFANSFTTPSDPTGTASNTYVMMGLGSTVTLTPSATGNVNVSMTGTCYNTSAADGLLITLAYGTGTAPTNGAAATGTLVGNPLSVNEATAGGAAKPFTVIGNVTGLSTATAYWFDLQVHRVALGTATVRGITALAQEY